MTVAQIIAVLLLMISGALSAVIAVHAVLHGLI